MSNGSELSGAPAGGPPTSPSSQARELGLAAVTTLGHALGGKDHYTLGHAARVAAYTRLLAGALGWPDDRVMRAEQSAFVHDIGKLAVSDRVLRKVGPLNDAEWEQVRDHPVMSAGILAALLGEETAREARHHHERIDGGGYPDGLSGDEIPEISRAICVADSYDAMSHRRPYRRARAYFEAVDELRRCRGTQFDPEMVDAFEGVLERLRERKRRAEQVAAEAAARIDTDVHAQLRTPEDMERPEYVALQSSLGEVLAAAPECVAIITGDWWDGSLHLVVDCDADPGHIDPCGRPLRSLEEPELLRRGERFESFSLHAYGSLAQPVGWVAVDRPDGRVGGVVGCFITLDDGSAGGVSALLETALANREAFGALLARAARGATTDDVEALTDDLTALYNHRFFQERLEAEVMRAREEDSCVSLLVADIDDFGEYNEVHGWSSGDGALCAVGGALEAAVGRGGMACRFSEDQFAVILPGADLDVVVDTAQNFCETVFNLGEREALRGGLTVSVGLAVFPRHTRRRTELLAAALDALAAAKEGGKNRVAIAPAKPSRPARPAGPPRPAGAPGQAAVVD